MREGSTGVFGHVARCRSVHGVPHVARLHAPRPPGTYGAYRTDPPYAMLLQPPLLLDTRPEERSVPHEARPAHSVPAARAYRPHLHTCAVQAAYRCTCASCGTSVPGMRAVRPCPTDPSTPLIVHRTMGRCTLRTGVHTPAQLCHMRHIQHTTHRISHPISLLRCVPEPTTGWHASCMWPQARLSP